MRILCIGCKRSTNHSVLYETEQKFDDETGWWEEYKYQIIQCNGCDSISFRKLYTDVALKENSEHTNEDPWLEELFPQRSIHTLPIRNLLNTPSNIKKIYRETVDAYNNDQSILCCVGLRAIIEGICNEKGIQGGDVVLKNGNKKYSRKLDGKIEGLVSKGFLTLQNADALHDLRFLGNEAVHELAGPSTRELATAIKIIEHLLDTIYEMQRKAAQLKSMLNRTRK